MIANKWYCIAQTSTFDTRCSINVAFDGHDIQFSASVKYGASSINITRCIIPDGISFSIRLRESGSQWFVDITSSAKITPVVTVSDSEYWTSVNKPAAEGNIILLLTDITSKYNTSSFGGDSLFELVNVGTSDVPRYAVVPKVFQGQNPGVISRTFMTFGGLGADSNGEDDPSGVSYLRNLLDVRLSEFLEDSDVLTYDKNQDLWVNKKGGFNEEKLEEYLEKYKYITEDDIKGLLVLLQWFEFDDANHAVRVKSDFNFVVPNALSFGGLGTYSGGGEGGVSYLKNLLDVQLGTLLEDGEVLVYDKHLDRWVNKSIETGLDVDSLQKYLTDNKYITSAAVDGLQGQINNNATNIALLLSWLEYDEVNKALRVKNGYNFIVDGALSFGGLGEDDNPTPGGLTQVTIQLGNNPNDSYVSENGKVILPAYPIIPTLLSAFENDKGYLVVSDLDCYAKLTDIPSVDGFALAEDLNALSKQIEGYDNKFADVGESILDIEEDISKLAPLADLEKLEEAVNPLFGYFDANGSANNALKLGGQLPSYYATKSALDTTNGNVVSLTQRMGTAESGISTNKTNIATLITDLSNLTSRVSTAEGTIKGHTDAIALNANNIASNSKSITTNANAITAVSNRVKTFEDVIGIDANGDVYIKGTRNFYTEGGTIGMAGLGSGGSGGGGTAGLGSVTVRVNGQDYITDASGIVTLPNYPSLAGYATEDYVTSRGYITNAALNGYAKLTDIPTSLPASDVYSWAKKSSLAAADVPNLDWSKITSGKPTTLSGYGITDALNISEGAKAGVVNSTDSIISWSETNQSFIGSIIVDTWYNLISIRHRNGSSDGNKYGMILYSEMVYSAAGSNLKWRRNVSGGWDDERILLDTYNYTSYTYPQSTIESKLSGYLSLNGGMIKDSAGLPLVLNTSSSTSVELRLQIQGSNRVQLGYNTTDGVFIGAPAVGYRIGITTGGTPIFYNGANRTLIHSGNIGSQSVNYATSAGNAEKVAGLPITIGDNNPWGTIPAITTGGYMDVGRHFEFHYDNTTGSDYSTVLMCTGNYGNIVNLPYFSGTLALLTDNVASATKLQTARTIWGQSFDGTGDITGAASFANGRVNVPINGDRITFNGSGYSMGILAMNNGNTYIEAPLASDSSSAAQTPILIGWRNGVYPFYISTPGNVLIGTTSDNGTKLQVEGVLGIRRVGDSASWLGIDVQDVRIRYRGYDNSDGYVVHDFFSNDNQICRIDGLNNEVIAYGSIRTQKVNLYNKTSIGTSDGYLSLGSYSNEICISGVDNGDLYINYRPSHNGSAPTAWIWCAGSSSSRATFFIGELRSYGISASGNLTVTGDITSEGTMAMARLASSSDRKLKDNIAEVSAEQSMSIIRQLRPTTWDWKKDGKKSYGFIAQEVEPIVPEMVVNMEHLHLEYNQLHAFEIGAIQHIDSEVEILKRRVNELENELKQYRRA